MPRLSIAAVVLVVAACRTGGPRAAQVDAAAVTAIELATADGVARYCVLGDPPALDVVVTTADGRKVGVQRAGAPPDGKLPRERIAWRTSWGEVDAAGRLQLPLDAVAALGRSVKVEAWLVDRPALVGAVALAPDFACGGVIGVAGLPGAAGTPGAVGATGIRGAIGEAGRAAGAGEHGGNGGDGGAGADGGDAPALDVALAYVTTSDGKRMMAVRVRIGARTTTALVDPAGKPWTIVAVGGDGGSGGAGGRGGRGGPGGESKAIASETHTGGAPAGSEGAEGGRGGDGGRGGNGGRGGRGGRGGTITVTYDARFPELAERVRFETRGGAVGAGGAAGAEGAPGRGGAGAVGFPSGADGRPGVAGQRGVDGSAGAAGTVDKRAGEVAARFADLAARGLALAAP
jgi:hypothetical protein